MCALDREHENEAARAGAEGVVSTLSLEYPFENVDGLVRGALTEPS